MKTRNYFANIPIYVILQRMNNGSPRMEIPKDLIKVPHIKQTNENSCGAAALCMIYKYYKLDLHTEEKIWTRLKKQRKLNTNEEIVYLNDLYNDIRNNGLHNITGQAVWEDSIQILELLKEFLRIKVPLVVCQRWRENQPFSHYKIVIGLEEDFVWVNDPEFEEEAVKIPKDRFIEDWQKYSDEVIGGHFFAALDEEQIKKLGKLPLITFNADVKSFVANNFQFLP